MRSALALSALLLQLLLLPPRSLSNPDASRPPENPPTAAKATAASSQAPTSQRNPIPVTTGMTTTMTTTTTTITAQSQLDRDSTSRGPSTSLPPGQRDTTKAAQGPAVTSSPAQTGPSLAPASGEKRNVDGSPAPTNGSQDSSSGRPPVTTAASPQTTSSQNEYKGPVTTGDQSSHHATANHTATPGAQLSPQPTNLTNSSKPVSTPSSASTPSPRPSTDAASKAPESSPEGQHLPTTIPSSPGPVSHPGFTPTSPWRPTAYTLPGASQGPQPTSSQMPTSPALPSSTAPLPTGSSVGPGASPTSSTTNLAPNVPQSPSAPSRNWTVGNTKVQCDPPVKPNEELLILNLTKVSLCAESPPDDKLVTLLCRSVKASFSLIQDVCTVQLVPVVGSQAVAVKRITMETKFPPKDLYELLKDKWDDLREAGVSNIQLGNEGPPEDTEDRFSMPLIITIVCMASFLLLVAALYGCCHQRLSQRKDQQRLTEELQTVENGYHDNPTLEVMETSSEMQEKKVVSLNGELGDSWIVPLDNLTKDDLEEEEDTHL